MQLIILTPGKTVYSGEVTAVNTPGASGKLEILDNHAPLVTSLKEGTVDVITANSERLSFETTGGFLEVLNNQVSILLETVSS